MNGPLDELIKEQKDIRNTITKISDPEHTGHELRSLHIASKTGVRTPKVVSSTDTAITLEHFPGISVFRAFEILAADNRYSEIDMILKQLGQELRRLQTCSHAIKYPYPFQQKLEEITHILRDVGEPERAKELEQLTPNIVDAITSAALVPFRDATPKNYILLDTTEEMLQNTSLSTPVSIGSIDFATFHTGTHSTDDVLSLTYHYMIPDHTRNRFLASFAPDLATKAGQAAKIMRLGRFWVRRVYYQKYHPELFAERYRYESLDFYTDHFFRALDCFSK